MPLLLSMAYCFFLLAGAQWTSATRLRHCCGLNKKGITAMSGRNNWNSCHISCFILLFKEASQRTITTDIEIKVLNDLDDKLHDIPELTIARPEVGELLDRESANQGPKESIAMYVLYIYAYAFHMRQRKVLRDNEWAGWIWSVRAAFRKGTRVSTGKQ